MKQQLEEFYSYKNKNGDPCNELPDDIRASIMDIGAFKGAWGDIVLAKSPNVNLYLIEPLKSACKILNLNFQNHKKLL